MAPNGIEPLSPSASKVTPFADRELLFEERDELVRLRLLRHPEERPQLDPVGMGLDLRRLGRQLLRRPLEDDRFALWRLVRDPGVRVHDRGGLEVLERTLLPRDVPPLERGLDAGA